MRHRLVVFGLVLMIGALQGSPLAAEQPVFSVQDEAIRTIPDAILLPGDLFRLLWQHLVGPSSVSDLDDPSAEHVDVAFEPRAILYAQMPQHPYMAANHSNNMHCDSSMSDTYPVAGPSSNEAVVTSRSQGFGGYGTVAFDQQGRIVAVFSNGRRFQLELIDPYTLEELASYDLPARPWYWLLSGILPWEYIGAGMYFFLDHLDRAVVPTTENTILVLQTPTQGNQFKLVAEFDLSGHVVDLPWPRRDSVAWVLPDWSGEVYWFATTQGVVGTVELETGTVRTLRLQDEVIENSFAVDASGVYIVSDHAVYRFQNDVFGEIATTWRTPYDRGPGVKPGHITRGSGTSVSLVGVADGLVLVTDNAEPRIHLLAIEKEQGSIVCQVPLFEDGRSGTDISVACFEHADPCGNGLGLYSVLVENNWGHHAFPRSRPASGLVRIDLSRKQDGSYDWEHVWSSAQKSIGVFKLSLGDGFVYMYWRSESTPITTWFLTRVDFETGAIAGRTQIGTGLGFNNWAGALFLHPEGGAAYSTTIFGLVQVRDPEI